jgi:hypothetical protein
MMATVLQFPPRATLRPESDDHTRLDEAIAALTQPLSIREKIELIAKLSEE